MAGEESALRSPASMLRAASVAIVGASERARWASQIFNNLRHNGYGGKIHLVNPRQQIVYGERCVPSLRDIGEPVDHAMVIVPAPRRRSMPPPSATARATRRGSAATGSRSF